ncbi:uncharacterized protein LOC108481083 [Gossypium arboreum]|uniref:uncharacterized protein LOC108481083 n=1 Tax=Gossypium arboreum TaxID=29729 RepID=UPI0008197ABE|nr:uncharacterized protein LOC108481083 [Gossypium arboreum]
MNLRQWRCLDLIKDYELIIDYHLGKANVVTDALSRKSLFALRTMNAQLALSEEGSVLTKLKARPTFLQEICETQNNDDELQTKRTQCESGVESDLQISTDGCLIFQDRVCVPKDNELVQRILRETHSSCLSIHPEYSPTPLIDTLDVSTSGGSQVVGVVAGEAISLV